MLPFISNITNDCQNKTYEAINVFTIDREAVNVAPSPEYSVQRHDKSNVLQDRDDPVNNDEGIHYEDISANIKEKK